MRIAAVTRNNTIRPGSFPSPARPGFEVSDFFEFNDWIEGVPRSLPSPAACYDSQNMSYTSAISSSSSFLEGAINRDGGREEKREKVAFKTKSEVEVLDDGFKWRKYGKKMVKNSPNPRNYYRCSVEGCPVKKRSNETKRTRLYVVTTYEGIHNHQVLINCSLETHRVYLSLQMMRCALTMYDRQTSIFRLLQEVHCLQ
ncbi:probable WRKY transcription factor 51 [Salvia hispanica]|uniref:probable WRKY transcription factor 51 n=1 Tax=Salvia hispanica TaxID=49212 RepID=UPI0020093986|nr:probable WRKY transcription factor 51 [Salvia hispanica]